MLLRKMRPTDLPLVTSSWLRSFRGGDLVEAIPNNIYFHWHHKIIEQCLANGLVVIACDAGNPDLVFGWASAMAIDHALVINYVYVKNDFRKFGIAKQMIESLIDAENRPMTVVSHINRQVKEYVRKKGWVYNPYLLFMNLERDWHHDSTH